MAELICIGVTAGVAGAAEMFFRRPADSSVPRYSEHMKQLERTLLRIRSQKEEREQQQQQQQQQKKMQMSKGEMDKIQKAAKYHGIDLNSFGVSSQDRVSGDLPKRMQDRQVMNIPGNDPHHFNRSELDGNIALDSSSQLTYEQATARNAEREAVNNRYHNEQGGMLFENGVAEHQFDGEQSHYGSSGRVQRPKENFPTKQGQVYGNNSTYAEGDLIAPMHVAKGSQQREVPAYRTHNDDGVTEVAQAVQRRVNPRQQHPSNIHAPDTITAQRPKTDWYEQNVSEEQVNRMIKAPTSSTQRVNQDLYESVKSEAEVERIMNSQNHMNTVVAANKASMTTETDSNFKFYTDTGDTNQAQPTAPQRQAPEVHPQHNIHTIDLSEAVTQGQRNEPHHSEIVDRRPVVQSGDTTTANIVDTRVINESERDRILGAADTPLTMMDGSRKQNIYREQQTGNATTNDFTTTTVSEQVAKRTIIGQQMINEQPTLGDDTVMNVVSNGVMKHARE